MRTLYLRIVVTTIFVMLLSSALAFIFSNFYYQYHLKPYNDKKITDMANDIKNFYHKSPEIDLSAYLNSVGDLGYQLYLVDSSENGSFYGGEFREKDIESNVVQNVLAGDIYHGIAAFPSTLFITGFFDNVLINSVGVPITVEGEAHALFIRPDIEAQFGELRIFLALLLVFIIVLSMLLVLFSTRHIVKPITKLTEATKKIGKGKYNIQLDVKSRDEIGQLASHFKQMAKNLEQLEEMRQEFVSNVSHEIQSPLASIQGFSQTLQTENLSAEQRQEYLSIIEEESRRMSQVSKQLLTLASLDKEEGILEKSSFDVAAQIRQVLLMIEWSWREKDLAIEMDLPSTVINADQKLLHQVWANLIINAIKFTEKEGMISLRIFEKDGFCLFEIKDTGIGISEQDLPNIFNRFYKADKSRMRKEGSSGLGLAIAKRIVEMHDGEITAESQLEKGTIFQIRLPQM